MPLILTNFRSLRPPHLLSQEAILDWIAKAHTHAAKESSLYPVLREKLLRLGAGPGKIEERGVTMTDCLHENWDEMTTQSGSFAKRMQFYDQAVTAIFDTFYEETSLPAHLVHVTCTGYVSPSGAQKVVSKKEAKTAVTHAYHMGCYAALPAIRMVQGLQGSVDIVHTELCALHMDPTTHDTEQLVVQALFADGFIKYSVASEGPGLEVVLLQEEIIPGSSWAMSWGCEDWGLKMRVAKEVPVLIARALPSFLEKLSLDPERALFAIHPGGPKIIDQVAKILNLQAWQTEHSRAILKSCGNMSSATLPHIWESMLKDPKVQHGTPILSLAFGPGLTLSGGVFVCRR
jgi:predicted naringenin-chalcone synthase